MIIYKITNIINNKIYIGQTIKTVEQRFKQHSVAKSLIGSAIRKFGIENFKVEIIEKCTSREHLNEREKFWIAHFNCKFPNGYNCTDGGTGKFPRKRTSLQEIILDSQSETKSNSLKTQKRRNKILDCLKNKRIAYSSELSQILNASPMTIYRDFQALAKKGLVTLIRGGAVLHQGTAVLYSLQFRQTSMPIEKQRIAKYCANLVNEGEIVFIDCGSTADLIAHEVKKKNNITIMTNSLNAACILSSNENLNLIMVPGLFKSLLHGFSGQMTTDFMSRFQVDHLFLGANGLDIVRGLTSPDFTDAETKRVLIKHARQIIVATDHTKLGKNFFVRIAKLSENKNADLQMIKEFQDSGANIILV